QGAGGGRRVSSGLRSSSSSRSWGFSHVLDGRAIARGRSRRKAHGLSEQPIAVLPGAFIGGPRYHGNLLDLEACGQLIDALGHLRSGTDEGGPAIIGPTC